MTAPTRRRAAGDRGATLIEFAFVFPVLALLFAAMADLGFVVLGSSVASGAARDGARVGIIHYLDADDTSSAHFGRIESAVKAKLVGWIKPGTGAFVTVRCLDGDNLSTVKPCDDAIDIDKDVLEVTVSWEALAATGLLPVDRTQTDSARMVIIGEIENPGGGPVVPGGSTVGFSPITYTTTEADGDTTVELTVARSNSTGAASVNVTTVAGSATAPDDFTTVTDTVNFLTGASTASFTVPIIGDDVAESSETFTVELSNPVGATLLAGSEVATVTVDDDDGAATDTTPPALQALEMYDVDTDGRVDQVIARFNETLGSCNAAGAWTLANTPSGATLASVSVAGMAATLTLTEGPGAHDTAVGGFTLALTDAVAGICDPSGNSAAFAATSPADFAGPALLDFSESGGTDGKFEAGDSLELLFSEPLLPTPIPASGVQLAAAGGDRFTAPGVTNGSIVLNGDYIGNNKLATFGASVATYTNGNTTVRLVLGACTSDCQHVNTQSSPQSVSMTPAPTITDPAGRGAVGTVTKNVRLF